jgi:hypothetical protein
MSSPEQNENTKTGAIVCTTKLPDTDELQYRALLFITGVPIHTSDRELEALLGGHLTLLGEDYHEIFVRADINASSNEVAEQFNFDEDDVQKVVFETLI